MPIARSNVRLIATRSWIASRTVWWLSWPSAGFGNIDMSTDLACIQTVVQQHKQANASLGPMFGSFDWSVKRRMEAES